MNYKSIKILLVLVLSSLSSCGQENEKTVTEETAIPDPIMIPVEKEPHRYGGWYCPDNLNGFPAVDIADWKDVPVVNGRMATEEDTKTEASLILVDMEKYPNAKPLDITMPKLAKFYNHSTERDEIIIVIQAINVDNDSIVGFRYLNGGNGSAWLTDVTFLSGPEIDLIPKSKFVTHSVEISGSQDEIWEILTNEENTEALQPTFDSGNTLKKDWRKTTNVNYAYPKAGEMTAKYGDKLYGNFYIQNDFEKNSYTEKFFLREDPVTGTTELIIVCGPFLEDYDSQKKILIQLGESIKELAEKK
jgi:hypothetical protein